jgi:hypothetical protein
MSRIVGRIFGNQLMKQTQSNPYSAHHEIALLLPWYVNNTLRGTERNTVENHLKVCFTCRRELASLKKLSLAVKQEGSSDSAAHTAFSHLKNRIHKAEEPVLPLPAVIASPQRKPSRRIELKSPVFARITLALAATVVFFMLIPGYLDLKNMRSNDYRTLSDSEISKPRKNEIRVVFLKDAKQQQIDAILAKVHGQIVAGPSEQSVYTVRINRADSAKNMLETLEQLRGNPNIIFAEPAYALLSSDQADGNPL